MGHLKDIATILTPVLLAIIGLRINTSMQRQNRVAERNSAFVKQWADNFVKLAESIDASARRVILLYFNLANVEQFMPEEAEDFIREAMTEIRGIALEFDEFGLELEKYVGLAPSGGPALDAAYDELNEECRNWFRNKGGNALKFRDIKMKFSECARVVHLEDLSEFLCARRS